MSPEERLALETLVDRVQLGSVVAELSDICTKKSWHIRENWQDEITAREWERTARLLDTLVRRVIV